MKLSLRSEENNGLEWLAREFCPAFPETNPMTRREFSPNEEQQYFDSREKLDETETIVLRLIGLINVMGGGEEVYYGIARALIRTHRTLQQSFAGIVLRAIVDAFAYMEENRLTDLRNDAACKLGKALKAVMDEHYLPFI